MHNASRYHRPSVIAQARLIVGEYWTKGLEVLPYMI